MSRKTYCSYCGRVRQRCACHQPDSAMARFTARGRKAYIPLRRHSHYKRAVPPQIKQRERQTLRKNYRLWHEQLVAVYGERCANCGERDKLVLDHVMPIAKGGLSKLDNLQLLCSSCNGIKGKLVIDCRAEHDDKRQSAGSQSTCKQT